MRMKDISTRTIESLSGPMLIVHIHADCRDAMGANAVNTMAELLAPELENHKWAVIATNSLKFGDGTTCSCFRNIYPRRNE